MLEAARVIYQKKEEKTFFEIFICSYLHFSINLPQRPCGAFSLIVLEKKEVEKQQRKAKHQNWLLYFWSLAFCQKQIFLKQMLYLFCKLQYFGILLIFLAIRLLYFLLGFGHAWLCVLSQVNFSTLDRRCGRQATLDSLKQQTWAFRILEKVFPNYLKFLNFLWHLLDVLQRVLWCWFFS